MRGTLLAFIFLSNFCFGQEVTAYQSDLAALQNILKKTPSYKDQIKNESLKSYNQLYEKLFFDTSDLSSLNRFCKLAQLFFPIRDNHMVFYQKYKETDYKDSTSYSIYRNTAGFKAHQFLNINYDSLETKLSQSPADSIEGIYFLDTLFRTGVFRSGINEYTGVVLFSKVTMWRQPVWQRGEIAFKLFEYMPNHFKAIYADPIFKTWILYPNEKFLYQSLINSHFYGYFYEKNYTKKIANTDYVNLPRNFYDYHFKELQPGIQYMHIKQFFADTKAMKKSEEFYDSIKNLLTAENLILDLRNNQGGAEKVSKKFLKLLKEYVKHGNLYVIVNNGTFSQGEIFTLQLKQLPHVTILGQTTNGTLMYGSNYGKREKLPNEEFEVYITDMDGDKRLLPYEVNGVLPDIFLDDKSDWIMQVTAYILKQKS